MVSGNDIDVLLNDINIDNTKNTNIPSNITEAIALCTSFGTIYCVNGNNIIIPDNTLAFVDMEHESAIPVDSTTLRHIGDYYHCLADVVKGIENETNHPPVNKYEKIFDTEYTKKVFGSTDYISFIADMRQKDEPIKDELGGIHDEGLGWSPDGTYCGECSNITCVGCPNIKS